MLRELADVMAGLLLKDVQKLMEIRVKVNDAPTFKKGQKHGLGSHRPVRLTFVLGKIVELSLLEHIFCSWEGVIPCKATGWDWQAGKQLCGKVLGVLVDSKLNTSQQCALTAAGAKSILSCMNRSMASRCRTLYSTLILHQDTGFDSWPLNIRHRSTAMSSSGGHQVVRAGAFAPELFRIFFFSVLACSSIYSLHSLHWCTRHLLQQ